MNDTYYSDEAISQSKIKTFIESKQEYKAIYIDKYKSTKDSEGMKFGRFGHCYYYEFDTITDKYISIPDSAIVGGMMGVFIEHLANGITKEEAYILCGFKQSFETTLKSFTEGKDKDKNQKYYRLLLDSINKNIVSNEDFTIISKMKEVYLKENTYLKTALQEDWLIFNELSIKFKSSFSTLDLKAKLDKVYIKKDFSKVVIEDLKITEAVNSKEFEYNIRKFRYDIQQSFYKLAIQNWIFEKYFEVVPIENIEFCFIPQRKYYPYEILDFIEISEPSENKAYTDWTKALSELEACLLFNNWDKDKSTYVGNRKIINVW